MAPVIRSTLLNRLRYKHLLLLRLLDERRNLHRVAATMNIPQPAATRMLREIETTFDSCLSPAMRMEWHRRSWAQCWCDSPPTR